MKSLAPGLPGGALGPVCSKRDTTSEHPTAPSSTAILGTALAKKSQRDIVLAPWFLAFARPWSDTSQSMSLAGGSGRSCSTVIGKTSTILKHDSQHFPNSVFAIVFTSSMNAESRDHGDTLKIQNALAYIVGRPCGNSPSSPMTGRKPATYPLIRSSPRFVTSTF